MLINIKWIEIEDEGNGRACISGQSLDLNYRVTWKTD